MNKAIKNWKNIPVFAVITKSYSEKDIPKNIKAVEESFSKSRGINLKGILPIIAEEYIINGTCQWNKFYYWFCDICNHCTSDKRYN